MDSGLDDHPRAVARALACARDLERLEAVTRTAQLDGGSYDFLQRYARLACELTGAPISLVSLVDASRETVIALRGPELAEIALDASFGKHVVADGTQLCIPDSHLDAVLATSAATTEFGIRAYLGSCLVVAGQRVGTFCLIDPQPHRWDERERRIVDDLAAAVSAELQVRVLGEQERRQALIDPLTGLGNRRALALALEHELSTGAESWLGMLDLDGFKVYNESFGHPAGDDLLVRLADRLERAVSGEGKAFRMAGDEFCVLVPDAPLLLAAQGALRDEGPGYRISASRGSVRLSAEADSVTAAIALANHRLYGAKRARSGILENQIAAVLSVALAERGGDLAGHSEQLAALAREIAVTLGMNSDEAQQVAMAARLHDIGKMAISDQILRKPGPLGTAEWELIQRHPIIGERILAAAPALGIAASLVRSSNESYDGGGYPDGLAGDQIPLGARIIRACGAYDAMTHDRPYRRALSNDQALDELRRCAGTQFDPRVVEALVAALAARTN